MSPKQIIYESGAKLNAEESFLLDWVQTNIQEAVIVLAESQQDGVKTPDILAGNRRIEFKTTSGNLTTLDTLLRRAAKQSQGECVIVHLCDVRYSLDDAKRVAKRRMERSCINEVYLLHQSTVIHLQNQKEETNYET